MSTFASRPIIGRTAGRIAIVLTALFVVAPSALAKGPSQAVVTGPGIEPTPLRPPGSPAIGADLATMVEASGFFAGLAGDRSKRLLNRRPAGGLGPRYV